MDKLRLFDLAVDRFTQKASSAHRVVLNCSPIEI